MMKSGKYLIAISFILIISVSCAYYSFKGALPAEIKSIAIPLFDNNTPESGVSEDIMNSLLEAFISDNSLMIVDEDKADLILSGTINSIRVKPFTVQAGENVSESQVVVSVHVKCKNTKTGKVLFDKSLSEYGLMDVNAGLDERNNAIAEALELLSSKIVDMTLGGW